MTQDAPKPARAPRQLRASYLRGVAMAEDEELPGFTPAICRARIMGLYNQLDDVARLRAHLRKLEQDVKAAREKQQEARV